jgi:hypothetical protein
LTRPYHVVRQLVALSASIVVCNNSHTGQRMAPQSIDAPSLVRYSSREVTPLEMIRRRLPLASKHAGDSHPIQLVAFSSTTGTLEE